MTAAMMVIAFSQIFWEAGMGKALIHRQSEIEAAANIVFWVNLVIGFVIAWVLYQFASFFAVSVFQDDRVASVIQVMSLYVILGAVASVQIALLQKSMDFKRLFLVRIITVAVPGVASVPLAFQGWGYWALVSGAIFGQFLQAIVLWWISPWRPTFKSVSSVSIQMSKFGGWVSLTGLLSWFYAWGDTLVVGTFFGLSDLGLYRVGHQLTSIIFSLIFVPILPVIYSYFSLHQNNRAKLQLDTQQAIELGIWVSLPIGVILYAYRYQFEQVLFGPEWVGLASIIGLMSIRQAFASITFMNGEAYRALGKPQYETIVLAISLVFYIPVYWYLAQVNLNAFMLGRIGLVVMSMIAHLCLISIVLKINLLRTFKLIFLVLFISGFTVYLVERIIGFFIDRTIIHAVISVVLTTLMMLIIFYLSEKNGLYKLVLSAVVKKPKNNT